MSARDFFTGGRDVCEDLLASATASGRVTDDVAAAVQAEVLTLVEQGARVIVSTCTTLGNSAEATPTNGRAAVELLGAVARARHTDLNLRELPCNDAWPFFLAGDLNGYARQVAALVDQNARPGEQVMLAQASMAPALPLIERRDVQVFTSPALGIRAALVAYARSAS